MTAVPTPDPAADVTAFLDLWFRIVPPGHFLNVRPLNKRTGKRPLPQSFPTSAEAASRAIVAAAAHDDDVYVGALPRREPSGKEKAVGARCWLWSDIDYGEIGHASPAPYSTANEAFDAIAAIGIDPTLVVDTGGGYHVWYALDAEPTLEDWREAIARLVHALKGDTNACDQARILRVPGTFNQKTDPPRPSRIVSIDPHTRHTIERFLSLPAVPPPEDPADDKQIELPAPTGTPTVPSGDRPFDRANDIPVAQILDWLGVKMHREGARIYCACPVHGGHNNSQMLVGGGDGNSAYCFGDCKRAHTPVDIVAAARRVDPKSAVNLIAERFNFDGFKRGPGRPPLPTAQVIQHPSANRPRPAAIQPAPPSPEVDPASPTDPQWRFRLDCNAKGQRRMTLNNIFLILRNHEKYAGKLTYDQMRLSPMYDGKPTRDTFDTSVRQTIEHELGSTPTVGNTREVIAAVAEENAYNPVRRYLESVQWDQRTRIDRVAQDILGAREPISSTLLRKWFISAVARATNPGCQVDTALILVGPQGALKSTFFRILGGQWFADSRMDISRPDSYLQLHSAWIYEWAELETIASRKEAGEVKSFITSPCDSFRAPYGRSVQQHPRTTVIVGTTNEEQFLTDPTGARRFHIVRVPDGWRIDVQALTEWRDQLWAEAVHLHRAGVRHYLDSEDDELAQAEVAADHAIEHAWTAPLAEWLQCDEARKEPVTMHRLLSRALKIEAARLPKDAERTVGGLMRKMGWETKPLRTLTGFVRAWRPRRARDLSQATRDTTP